MLSVNVIAVGKVREKFFIHAAEEYKKRLGRFCRLNIIEIPDEVIPARIEHAGTNDAGFFDVLKKEGRRILEKIPRDTFVIALCIEGKELGSVEFAQRLERAQVSGTSNITLIIGGSLGLCDEIKERADLRLSFSKMTFPHQLMRVILLEQLYRAFKIIAGETYHK